MSFLLESLISSVQKEATSNEDENDDDVIFGKNYCFNFFFLIFCRLSSIIGGSSSGSSSSLSLESNLACRRSLVWGERTFSLRVCRLSLSRPLLDDGDAMRGLILIYIHMYSLKVISLISGKVQRVLHVKYIGFFGPLAGPVAERIRMKLLLQEVNRSWKHVEA